MNNIPIGEMIRISLNHSGMTQKRLSIESGVTEAALSRIINGAKLPRITTLLKLADALHVTTDYLLGR